MTPVPLNLGPAQPELFLAASGLALLLYGVLTGEKSTRQVSWLAIIVLAVTALLVSTSPATRTLALSGLFVADAFGAFMKLFVLLGAALGIVLSLDYNRREEIERFEFPVLIVFATLGMMLMISATDLISLYLGLELQSLSLYVVAAFRRDSVKSTEAGLKYFVLGALSSGMLLYGASLVYGFSGSTSFAAIAKALAPVATDPAQVPLGILFGVVFLVAGLAFKVSAAPFHMWTPDVYEGAPTPVTAFFAIAPKIAATALFVRVMVEPFGPLAQHWQQIIWLIAVLSMIVGAFAAIWQTNVKRLMAYSSIGHVGYALIGLVAGGKSGVGAIALYMAVYLFMNVAAFAVILSMRQKGRAVEQIQDLAGLWKSHPMMAGALGIAMFAMAGIPPLAGFLSKFYIFEAAVRSGFYVLAVVGVLTSVFGAFYYLRIVKIMCFDEPGEVIDKPIDPAVGAVLGVASLFTLFFILWPAPLIRAATTAAASLFPG
ncbi:MAG: NADH-quinone oxidoreductase subunit NuoN [Alphaproteobacteria bacterium]|nr:NADH-quinone oxidoreductase subunit NuoN [Alphaproteobacteria bacterium]